jgi:transcriptional regulator with XRE-family HTH domain
MTVGDRVLLARKRARWTQAQLGEALGTDQGTIAKIEANRQSGAKHLPKIAEVLDVPVAWLVVGENPPEWTRQVRSPDHDPTAEPSAIDRIATAVETMAASIAELNRRLAERDEREAVKARERADLRRQMARLQQEVRAQRAPKTGA